MRKTTALATYQLRVYFKGNRFIMPLIVTCIVLYMMYSLSPVSVVSSFSMTCYLIFIVMAWAGFGALSAENIVMEQIQLLRVQSGWLYSISKGLFLLILSFLADCICIAVPTLNHIFNHAALFNRQLQMYDIINAFFLLGGCAFAGGALGSILHPSVIGNRKAATLLTSLAVVLTIVRASAARDMPFLKYLAWALPPVDRVTMVYGNADSFQLAQTMGIFIFLMAYGVLYSIVDFLLKKAVFCGNM